MKIRGHVEVDFSAHPSIANLTKARCDQAQQGSDIWKDSDDAVPSSELLIGALDHVAGPHFHPMLWGQIKNSEALGELALGRTGTRFSTTCGPFFTAR